MNSPQKNIDKENIQKQIKELLDSDTDLQEEGKPFSERKDDVSLSPSETVLRTQTPKPYRFIPLTMGGGGRTHVPSKESREMILDEVSLKDLTTMTTNFYDKAFQDKTLDSFIRSHNDPHGSRFAKWIHQKLSGSHIWDQDRESRGRHAPVHDRTSAHVAAWYSPKRPASERGRHFELGECRVWMRLHFWALREWGLMEKSPSFADYYVRFIAHFVRVYESTAPAFARESLRWSANPKNIDAYMRNGREMKDVLKLSFSKAVAQLPEDEMEDDEWPYQQTTR